MLGPGIGYVDILDAETQARVQAELEKQKTAPPLRPSSAGTCTRALAYQLLEFHKKKIYGGSNAEASVHRLLKLGHAIEEHLIKEFEISGFKTVYRQQVLSWGRVHSSINPEVGQHIEGSIDLVLLTENSRCLIDVKSKKDWSTGRFSTHWKDTSLKLKKMASVKSISECAFYVEDLEGFLIELAEPFFENNFLQLNFYANNEFIRERSIDHCAIIQYNKNTSQLREIRFKPSYLLFKKTIQKFQNALDALAVENPEHVKRDYEKGSMVCRYCRFEKPCNKSINSTQK